MKKIIIRSINLVVFPLFSSLILGCNLTIITPPGSTQSQSVAPPTNLAYSDNPASYNIGANVYNQPNYLGSPVSNFTVSPALPGGLYLDPVSGIISGTPLSVSPAQNYLVIASNSAGATSVELSITVISSQASPTVGLQHLASVTYQGKVTTILQMATQGSSLFLTGYPFGFAIWGINGANAGSPQSLFAASEQVGTFSPPNSYLESWNVDNEASSALAISPDGKSAFTSGRLGSSVINVSNPSNAMVAEQYPRPNPTTGVPNSDPNFMFSGISFNPSGNLVYGFQQSGAWITLSGTLPELTPEDMTDTIDNACSSDCNVTNTAVFGSQIYVAYGGALMVLDIDPSGQLLNPRVQPGIRAANVVATENKLYVLNEGGTSFSTGIYAYDKSGSSSYIPLDPKRFAVSSDDKYLYTYQTDPANSGALQIYQITWGN